ncbi:hypothetical protein HPB52_006192 [Rhipicephalus sanguineus]|uniref:Uncharacterized protein n=1 Tax=Rhipicephalus sanguineus TaxID=34632 RepID=A0A9D4QDM0_RHISA|nr:hypothetical protein HPB52_006192 [Rhipicephalus sanguineus]
MEPTGGNAGVQKRRLREDIEKALAEYGEYSHEEVDEVIKILEKIGMKATKGFTVIERSDLLEKGMPAVVAGILMKAFEGIVPQLFGAEGAQDDWKGRE